MSNIIVWTNNASSTLASGILAGDSTCAIQAGQGALFPAIAAGQIAVCTLEDVSGNIEIVWATAKSTDTFTITRAQEGTSARAFASGSRFEIRVTAGVLGQLLQKTGGDTMSGTTNVTGVIALGGGGSIQGGEFTGALRGAPGQTGGQIVVANGGTTASCNGSTLLTTANITANLPSGFALNQTNMIVFWAGTLVTIPAGWHLCDGTSGTPDLRDLFIVGGGGAMATSGGSASTSTNGSHNHGGATGSYTLLLADIPAHTHRFLVSPGVGYAGGPNPPFTIPQWSSSSTPAYTTNIPAGFSGGPGQQIIENSGGGTGHTHPMSTDGAHLHTVTPPYRAVFAIMKT